MFLYQSMQPQQTSLRTSVSSLVASSPNERRELVSMTTAAWTMPSKMHPTEQVAELTNVAFYEKFMFNVFTCFFYSWFPFVWCTARILTSDAEVKKFLNKFPKLKVTSMVENPAAKPGGELHKRFKQRWDSLPTNQRTTCLAFHGTADANISSICQNGYNPKLRKGQAYGAGEYFATTPDIPLSYCKGGKRMLLNELLLGQQGTHHTMHGTIVVMKDAAHDLPRYVLTFQ